MARSLTDNALFRSIFDACSQLLVLFDPDLRVVHANQAALALAGCVHEDVVGQPFDHLFPGSERGPQAAAWRDGQQGLPAVAELTLIAATGHPVALQATLTPIFEGAVFAGVLFEASAGAVPDQQALLESVTVGIIRQDRDGAVPVYNAAAARLLGLSHEAFMGQRPPRAGWRATLKDGQPFKGTWPADEAFRTGKPPADLVLGIERPLGGLTWVLLSTRLLRQDSGLLHAVVTTVTDVTERKHIAGTVRQQALRDRLTGLPQRALLIDRLESAISRSGRERKRAFGLLLIEVGGLKAVSEDDGQAVGDEVTVALAERLASTLRGADTLARLGGDEFVILLEGVVVLADAVEVAERVIALLATPLALQGREIRLNASIGIALGDEPGLNAYALLDRANSALAQVKTKGPGRYAIFSR